MSTAHLVPETWELSGDDAWKTLARTGRRRLIVDAFQRLRWSDGFSHSRSLAFMVSLTAVQGLVAVVGFATAFGSSFVSDAIVTAVEQAAPGPVAGLLTDTVHQAQNAGATHNYLALILGSLGCLVSATTGMGQLERGLNRLYGIEQDRETVRKYSFACVLALSAGMLITIAFSLIGFGRTLASQIHNPALSRAWDLFSWPVGVALLASGLALLFRWCPRRHQPAWSWLAFGSGLALVLWTVVTLALGIFFRKSESFGQTYGPLAGMIALMLWSLLISISLFFGAAVAAQLEAVRADAAKPQDEKKVEESEPDAEPAREGAAVEAHGAAR